MATRTLYVLYNADSTILGKIRYGYRKLSSSGPESACAACDITNGGLSLTETKAWIAVKQNIESQGVKVVQWHRDEIDEKMKVHVKDTNLRYPAVVFGDVDGLKTVMTSAELNQCKGDSQVLLDELTRRSIVSATSTGKASL